MADDPIQQDISQASFAAGPAMPVANEDQQTPTALPIDRTGSGIGVHDSSGTSFGAPSAQDATAGSPQPNLPSSVTQAPKTAQPDYKESWTHKLGGVLAGGTHNATYKVNPDTGEIGVELKPKTGKEEIMGAVANILSGMASGAGQKNFAKGLSASAQQVTQQLQQRQGQQKQDAVDNYNQQQIAKVRKQQLYRGNIDNAMNTWQAEKNGTTDLLTGNYKTLYDNATSTNGVLVPRISQADAIAGLGSGKYKAGENIFIPLESVPKFDDEGKQTGEEVDGAIIKDTPYSFDEHPLNLDQLKSRGIIQPNLNPAKGATTSSAIVNSWIAKNTTVDQTLHEVNEVYKKVGLPAPSVPDDFYKNNPKAADAMQEFQQQLRGANGDIGKALENMTKTKVDKDGNQIANPDARFASVISQLLPNDVLTKYQKAIGKGPEMTTAQAQSIRAKAAAGQPVDPDDLKMAKNIYAEELEKARATAANVELGKEGVASAQEEKTRSMLTPPSNFQLLPDAHKMSDADLRKNLSDQGVKIPDNFAALVGIAKGGADLRTLPQKTYKGRNDITAQDGLSYIRTYIKPNYQESDYETAKNLNKELFGSTRGGTGGGVLLGLGTASQHLGLLKTAGDALNNGDLTALNSIANTLGIATGQPAPVIFQAIADRVNEEVTKVTSGGTPHEAELARNRETLSRDYSPKTIDGVIRTYIGLMGGRADELNERAEDILGKSIHVSPTTATLFKQYGMKYDWLDNKTSGKPATSPTRPTNVPSNYVFNQSGPKGAGWYKPQGQ